MEDKKNLREEFKNRHDIDFEVLLNPKHPKFEDTYSLEDEAKENLVLGVKLKSASR